MAPKKAVKGVHAMAGNEEQIAPVPAKRRKGSKVDDEDANAIVVEDIKKGSVDRAAASAFITSCKYHVGKPDSKLHKACKTALEEILNLKH